MGMYFKASFPDKVYSDPADLLAPIWRFVGGRQAVWGLNHFLKKVLSVLSARPSKLCLVWVGLLLI